MLRLRHILSLWELQLNDLTRLDKGGHVKQQKQQQHQERVFKTVLWSAIRVISAFGDHTQPGDCNTRIIIVLRRHLTKILNRVNKASPPLLLDFIIDSLK